MAEIKINGEPFEVVPVIDTGWTNASEKEFVGCLAKGEEISFGIQFDPSPWPEKITITNSGEDIEFQSTGATEIEYYQHWWHRLFGIKSIKTSVNYKVVKQKGEPAE